MARRGDRRRRDEKSRQAGNLDAQRKALRRILAGHNASSLKLGRHVFGGGIADATARTKGTAVRGILMDKLRGGLTSKPEWTVGEIANLRLVEDGPELGRDFADRVHRFLAIGRPGDAFDPRMPKPATKLEMRNAMAEYVRVMRQQKRWAPDKSLHDLTTTDIVRAPQNYLCAFLGINPRMRRHKMTENQRRALSFVTTDPAKALEIMEIRGGHAKRILDGLEMLRRIPRQLNLIMKLEGLKDSKYGYRKASGILLQGVSSSFSGELKKHRKDWGDASIRIAAAEAALQEAGGDPTRFFAKHIPHPLHYWYARNRGTRTWNESIVAWLGEAGLIQNDEQRHRILRRANPKLLWGQLLRRAHPEWSRTSHAGPLGVDHHTTVKHLGLARRHLESEFRRLRRGETSVSDIAKDLNVGARGITELHAQHSQGGMRLWGERPPFRRVGRPPLNRRMLTAGELLDELVGYRRILMGSRGKTRGPSSTGRVIISKELETVRDGIRDLLAYRRSGRIPPAGKVEAVIRSLGEVKRGHGKVTVVRREKLGRSKTIMPARLKEIRGLLEELREEVRAHQEA